MNIFLKSLSMQSDPQHVNLVVEERLPKRLDSPCKLSCEFYARQESNYYILHVKTRGMVDIVCQRCLQVFPYPFQHQATIAVCPDEATAERLMNQYECIVAENGQINILEVLTDDLYLFLPEKHPDLKDCDSEIRQLIRNDDEAIS